jgi:hypothetical protein
MLMAQGIPGFRESTDPADLDTQQRIMKIFVSVHTPLTAAAATLPLHVLAVG